MIADYGDGGQKMLDIMAFNKSLKIAWIVKYIYISDDYKSKWKNLGDFFLSQWGRKLVFLGNLEKQDSTKHDIKLIEIWVDFNFRDSFLFHDFCSSSSINMV